MNLCVFMCVRVCVNSREITQPQHNRAVQEASVYLRSTVAQACARVLEKRFDDSQKTLASIQMDIIRDEMHRFGLNMRHLSRVRERCAVPFVRLLLLTEMAMRTIWGDINAKLRDEMLRLKVSWLFLRNDRVPVSIFR